MPRSRILLTLLIATLIGGLAYGVVALTFAYRTIALQKKQLQNLLTTTGALRYGVVESVDPVSRTMHALIQRYPGGTLRGKFSVSLDALIVRQTLIEKNGAYESLSAPLQATLSDIQVGDRVAIQVVRTGDGLAAEVIYFGNPL